VKTCRKRSILTQWRSTLTMTVASVAWWAAVPSTPAQESKSPALIAFLSVSTVQPEPILNSVRERADQRALRNVERDHWPITVPHHKPTDMEAWEKFDSEFRPEQQSPSLVKRQIETAKYGVDTTLFAVDHFVKTIRDHADFELDQGGLHRTRANSREGFIANPRVKLDLDLTYGKPYLGARVVIPFGN
jgi:hypothetical protein